MSSGKTHAGIYTTVPLASNSFISFNNFFCCVAEGAFDCWVCRFFGGTPGCAALSCLLCLCALSSSDESLCRGKYSRHVSRVGLYTRILGREHSLPSRLLWPLCLLSILFAIPSAIIACRPTVRTTPHGCIAACHGLSCKLI